MPWPPITRLNDVEAELELRNIDPPVTQEVLESFAAIEGVIRDQMKNSTEGLTTGYLDEKIRDYYAAQEAKN